MNEAYLLDAFGREPRVSVEVAVQTLSEIWLAMVRSEAVRIERMRMTTPTIDPDPEQIRSLVASSDPGPIVMVNLLRFKERADRRRGPQRRRGLRAIRGRDGAISRARRGRLLAAVVCQEGVIGPATPEWDMVALVAYPSREAFLTMIADPEYLEVHRHRVAALADSRLILSRPAQRPNGAERCDAMTDVFRTPEERFEDLPGYAYEPNYVEVDGLRLHTSTRETGRTVLCFHGEPSWSYLYRQMLDVLVASGHRVVCPDLVGFGRSDKPTDQRWYTYERHFESVGAPPRRARPATTSRVVVQDWGGPIGLRWAAEHPEQVGRLCRLTTPARSRAGEQRVHGRASSPSAPPTCRSAKSSRAATATHLTPTWVAAYEAPFRPPRARPAHSASRGSCR